MTIPSCSLIKYYLSPTMFFQNDFHLCLGIAFQWNLRYVKYISMSIKEIKASASARQLEEKQVEIFNWKIFSEKITEVAQLIMSLQNVGHHGSPWITFILSMNCHILGKIEWFPTAFSMVWNSDFSYF